MLDSLFRPRPDLRVASRLTGVVHPVVSPGRNEDVAVWWNYTPVALEDSTVVTHGPSDVGALSNTQRREMGFGTPREQKRSSFTRAVS